MYKTVNEMLGDIVKVTPSSKMVGDLADLYGAERPDPGEHRGKRQASDLPGLRGHLTSRA